MIEVMQKVAAKEAQKIYTTEIGVVSAIFPHEAADDMDNYQCSITLQNKKTPEGKDFELRKVPVASQHVGLVMIPDVGDLVVVAFINGNVNAPIILARLYDEKNRPPENSAGQLVLKHLKNTLIELDSGTKIEIDPKGNVAIDSTGNISVTSQGQVSLQSEKDFSINSKGMVSVDATKKATIKSADDVVIESNGKKVIINKGDAGKGAARFDDDIEIYVDPKEIMVACPFTGSPVPLVPIILKGKIVSASETVQVGD
ncbi:MAG: phage baseplate assembly protein V [Leptospirales bacterium]